MDRAFEFLTNSLPWLWQTSLQGGVLVLLILLVQWLFRKRLAPQWRYALWGVLVLRLVLVWTPSSSFSVYNLAPEATPRVFVAAPTVERPRDVAPVVESVFPSVAEEVDGTTLREEIAPLSVRDSKDIKTVSAPWSLADAVALSWLVVFASLLSLLSLQSLHFARKVRAGQLVTNSETLELLESCRRQLKVTTFVTLMETDCVTSPALLGCIRPKLVVPPGFFDGLSQDAARYVFLHELAHVKRGDIWTSWLMNLLVALHWFNPAIWFARRRFIIDRETACDAHVLRHLDPPAQRQYGVTLLDLMERFSTSQWAPGIAGISESNSNLKRRIHMIKDFRSPTRLAAWSGVGLCLLVGLATLTNAQVEETKNDGGNIGHAQLRQECQNQLKQLGLVFKMYANQSQGMMLPVLSQEPGRLMFAWGGSDEKLNDINVLSIEYTSRAVELTECPLGDKSGELPDDGDFVYLGYLLQSDEDVRDFAMSYGNEASKGTGWRGGLFVNDLPPSRDDGKPLVRLREGIERFIITDINNPAASAMAQSKIPTMIEWPKHPTNSGGKGGNVLYMDGHVEFLAYPGQWPMTEATIGILAELAGRVDESSGIAPVARATFENNQKSAARLVDLEVELDRLAREIGMERTAIDVDQPALDSLNARRDVLQDAVEKKRKRLEGTPKEGKNYMEGLVLGVGNAVNDQYRADCQNHMKHLGLALKMFSSDSDRNVFPPLSGENGTLMFGWGGDNRAHSNGALLSAEYIAGVEQVSRCPLSPLPASDTPGDQDYVYLGYLVNGDKSVRDFADAYRERMLQGGEWLFEEDLNFGDAPVYRLREGIERVFTPNGSTSENDAWTQAKLPVLIEWPDRHETSSDRQGGNVLFMDGHVEFMVYPGRWPMTEETIGILAELAGRAPVELTHTGGMSLQELRERAAGEAALYSLDSTTPQPARGRRGTQPGGRLFRLGADNQEGFPKLDLGKINPDTPCDTRLKYLGLVLKIFANESPKEVFPPLSRDAGNMMFAWGGESRALGDQAVLSTAISPSIPATVVCRDSGRTMGNPDDTDFVYLGYLMRDEGDLRRFAEAYARWAAAGADKNNWFADDKPGSPDGGIIRIREGVERFIITDINNPAASAMAQSQIPVVIEWPDHHGESGAMGGNVLFMDGHVEFMEYPGTFPMTEEAMGILCTLAGREAIAVDAR